MAIIESEQKRGHYEAVRIGFKYDTPIVEGIPDGDVVLFLARIDKQR